MLKWCYFKQDSGGLDVELRYFRDVDKREVDFVLVENQQPVHFIECKPSGKKVGRSLGYLKKHFPLVPATQIVLEDETDFITKQDIRVRSAAPFLKKLI